MSYYRAIPVPTESEEQQALFRWAAYESAAIPELKLLYHIPNEGKRSRATGGRMKAEGLKSGVPDICLPVARGGNHGLYIELKRTKNSSTSSAQLEWLENLMKQGYYACICKGWEAAKKEILKYLNLEKPGNGDNVILCDGLNAERRFQNE